jgi:tetratricopeptide (TPR) repeat protein
MKKMMMMAMMATVAATAFAQDDLVKQAEKIAQDGDLAKAVSTITPALTSAQTTDKAAAWNTLSNMYYQGFSAIQQKKLENQVKKITAPVDEVSMAKYLVEGMKAAQQCDVIDQQPNEKGKVKIKFRKDNATKYISARLNLVNFGQDAFNKKDFQAAFDNFAGYVNSCDYSLFSDPAQAKDLQQGNAYKAEVAYYASLAAYNMKNYAEVVKYAQIAAKDTAKAKEATEILIFAKKETIKTKADTLEYVQMLKDAAAKFPNDQRYSAWIGDYYLQSNNTAALSQWADQEIAKNPTNKFAYTYKGEAFRLNSKWDDAIACYNKASELDPTYIVAYYQAGVCLNSKAIDLKEKLSDKRTGMLTVANVAKVKEVLTQAKEKLEKVRSLDPNRDQVKWAYALYQVYYSLGDKAKVAELEPLIKQ